MEIFSRRTDILFQFTSDNFGLSKDSCSCPWPILALRNSRYKWGKETIVYEDFFFSLFKPKSLMLESRAKG